MEEDQGTMKRNLHLIDLLAESLSDDQWCWLSELMIEDVPTSEKDKKAMLLRLNSNCSILGMAELIAEECFPSEALKKKKQKGEENV